MKTEEDNAEKLPVIIIEWGQEYIGPRNQRKVVVDIGYGQDFYSAAITIRDGKLTLGAYGTQTREDIQKLIGKVWTEETMVQAFLNSPTWGNGPHKDELLRAFLADSQKGLRQL
ncbi:MAG: hypothetical protein Q7S61_03215 [bacterium]|nr:hypothetical protein [bacterium]